MARSERLKQPEFAQEALEDALVHIFAMIHDVENKLMRAALQGRASAEVKANCQMMLRSAADRIDQIPEVR